MARSRTRSRTTSADGFEADLGKLPVAGRFHKAPKRFEDDYTLSADVLGTGFGGAVRLATRNEQRRGIPEKFAVKTFDWSTAGQSDRPRIVSEVSVFLAMDHPHIVRLHDVYSSDDRLHLVMECMEGGHLLDRIVERSTFPESSAADAVWQMLLAVNYIHSRKIVHRDVKLENFLFDKRGSDHLRLLDFGFSRFWDPGIKMKVACGTVDYMAPEVLGRSYTSRCDVWSLGVIAFVLLGGYSPFTQSTQSLTVESILAGRYTFAPQSWDRISTEAKDFVASLLNVDPERRPTAQAALEHTWIADRHQQARLKMEECVVSALRSFAGASRFRRCCLLMLAWSLTSRERAELHQYFISLDKDQNGAITLNELKSFLEDRFEIDDKEARRIFSALDPNSKDEICYTDFLAAMVSTRIKLHDDMLSSAFQRFDTDGAGYIRKESLQDFLGGDADGARIEELMAEAQAHQSEDGKISYPEFVSFLRGDLRKQHADKVVLAFDRRRRRGSWPPKSDLSPGLLVTKIHSERAFGPQGRWRPPGGAAEDLPTISGRAKTSALGRFVFYLCGCCPWAEARTRRTESEDLGRSGFVCPNCNRSFDSRRERADHWKLVHCC